MNCLFCSIAKRTIPSEIIFEDQHTMAFLDIHPRSLGHTIVIDKAHAATIVTLSKDEVNPLFLTVRTLADILDKALHPQGFTIGINHGAVAGQEIDHLHVHIIPRFVGDRGGSLQSVVSNVPDEKLEDVAMKIRSKVSNI